MDLPNFKLKDLIDAGVHFGHKSRRWNPKMSKYIHSTRENVHIIDLGITIGMLTDALKAYPFAGKVSCPIPPAIVAL